MKNEFVKLFKGRSAILRRAERKEDGFYDVKDIITWLLNRDSMSPKKLQKMLYYSYAWALTLGNDNSNNLGNKLFNEKFEAWVHGPVVPTVYREYKKHGFSNIPSNNEEIIVFDEEVEDVLNQVWEVYGGFTGNELESMTHQETPWTNAREGLSPIQPSKNIIADEDIFNFYLNEMMENYE